MASASATTEVRLAEFAALRGEMQHRSNAQQGLIGLDLTVLGSIAGFVLSGQAAEQTLLVLPLVSPVLGLLWIDHARNIEAIGGYIERQLWKWQPSWEKTVRNRESPARWRAIEFGSAIGLVFFGPAAAGLAGSLPLSGVAEIALAIVGVILTTVYTGIWIRFVRTQWLLERRSDRS